MAGRIYLGRHGDTALNEDDRERAWSSAPLNADGRAEAQREAGKLEGKGVEIIISSDLERAKQTAQIMGDKLGVEPQSLFGLRTWNLGEFTGRLCREVEPEIRDYIRNRRDEVVPGGESFNGFKERVFDGLVAAIHMAGERTLLLVVHSRIIMLIEGWTAAGQPSDHRIDIDVMLEQGEAPGGVEEVKLNITALEGYSDARFASAFSYMRG